MHLKLYRRPLRNISANIYPELLETNKISVPHVLEVGHGRLLT